MLARILLAVAGCVLLHNDQQHSVVDAQPAALDTLLSLPPVNADSAPILADNTGLGLGSGGNALIANQSDLSNGVDPAILNGVAASSQPGWIVYLLIEQNNGAGQPIQTQCGGSLISSSWVLTAAHCFRDCAGRVNPTTGLCSAPLVVGDGTVAMVGGTNLNKPLFNQPDPTWHLTYISKVIVHPKFWANKGVDVSGEVNIAALPFDVALVKLETPAPIKFKPIAYSCNANIPARNDRIVSYGWGFCVGPRCTPFPGSTTSQFSSSGTLQTTGPNGLPVVPCPTQYPVTDTCLKGNGPLSRPSGICQGDSGGPNVLMTGGPAGAPLLVAVTSFSYGENSKKVKSCQSPLSTDWASAGSGLLRTGSVCSWIKSITTVAGYTPPVSTTTCVTPLSFPAGLATTAVNGGTCTPNTKMASGSSCLLACAPRFKPSTTVATVRVTCSKGALSPALIPTSAPLRCLPTGCDGGAWGFILPNQPITIAVDRRYCPDLAAKSMRVSCPFAGSVNLSVQCLTTALG